MIRFLTNKITVYIRKKLDRFNNENRQKYKNGSDIKLVV